jgi:hypothetical protein
VPNLYVETGIQHVSLLLQETHSILMMGKLLRMSIEATKVEIGVGGSLFTQSFDQFGQLATDSWVKQTWHFLSEYGITTADHMGDLQLCHCEDVFLTKVFIQHGLKGAALKRMNVCQLYLRVETLSDITAVDGRYIMSWAIDGRRTTEDIRHHEWLNQGDPGRQAWMQWHQVLESCFCSRCLAHGLLHALGKWTESAPTSWQWWYSLQEERIYRQLEGNWHFYSVRRSGWRTWQQRFLYSGEVEHDEVPICR